MWNQGSKCFPLLELENTRGPHLFLGRTIEQQHEAECKTHGYKGGVSLSQHLSPAWGFCSSVRLAHLGNERWQSLLMYRHRFLGNKLALVELHLCSRDKILADAPQSPSEAMFCLCVPRQVITDRGCIQLKSTRRAIDFWLLYVFTDCGR